MAGPASEKPPDGTRRPSWRDRRDVPSRRRRQPSPGVEHLDHRILLAATIPLKSTLPLGLVPTVLGHTLTKTTQPPTAVATKVSPDRTSRTPVNLPPNGPPPTPVMTVTYSSGVATSSASPITGVQPPASSGILIGNPTTKAGDVGNHQNLGPTPITPEGILKLSALPWTEEVQITDTLNSSQPSATYKIPVGPTTKSFKVTVDPSEPTEGPEVPVIDQLYLVSPTGTILVAMQGVAANVQGNHQAIDISLNNVPAGGQLLVHVGEQAIFSASESVPNPPPAAGVDLAFRMDVHRNDPGGSLFLNYVGLQAAGRSSPPPECSFRPAASFHAHITGALPDEPVRRRRDRGRVDELRRKPGRSPSRGGRDRDRPRGLTRPAGLSRRRSRRPEPRNHPGSTDFSHRPPRSRK